MAEKGKNIAGKSVLIVDDMRDNVFSLGALLETYDMEIDAVYSAEASLKRAGEKTFDIILMDIRMPGMDGYEAIRRLRENPANIDLPIIAVTAQAMPGDKEKCLDAGADDYISKPIDTDLLIEKINALL